MFNFIKYFCLIFIFCFCKPTQNATETLKNQQSVSKVENQPDIVQVVTNPDLLNFIEVRKNILNLTAPLEREYNRRSLLRRALGANVGPFCMFDQILERLEIDITGNIEPDLEISSGSVAGNLALNPTTMPFKVTVGDYSENVVSFTNDELKNSFFTGKARSKTIFSNSANLKIGNLQRINIEKLSPGFTRNSGAIKEVNRYRLTGLKLIVNNSIVIYDNQGVNHIFSKFGDAGVTSLRFSDDDIRINELFVKAMQNIHGCK